MHPLKLWLSKKQFYNIKKGNNVTFFDGGCAKVPEEFIHEFLVEYSRCCTRLATYMVEKPDKSIGRLNGLGFRYVMDLDFKIEDVSRELPTIDSIVEVVIPEIQICIEKLFPDCSLLMSSPI